MTPDSIILLNDDARLDALIQLLHESRLKAIYSKSEQDRDSWLMAWERLHDELMSQVDQPIAEFESDLPLFADKAVTGPIYLGETVESGIPDPFQVLQQPADTEV